MSFLKKIFPFAKKPDDSAPRDDESSEETPELDSSGEEIASSDDQSAEDVSAQAENEVWSTEDATLVESHVKPEAAQALVEDDADQAEQSIDDQEESPEEAPDVADTDGEVHPADVPAEKPARRPGLFARLRASLGKTRNRFWGLIEESLFGRREIDEELLEELEDIFLSADIGIETTTRILDQVRDSVRRKVLSDPQQLKQFLRDAILDLLRTAEQPEHWPESGTPRVILVIGVNGSGKTTSIGKLAAQYRADGKRVLMAAGDTFRAAAIEQLCMWGERTGVDVVRHQQGSDPSAVAYDATKAALARKSDLLLIDTAGRLHNKSNLMEELAKTKRVLSRDIPGAPHETWLVLDGTTGQNALIQARQFMQNIDITGFILTKLDSSSKGGAIIGIVQELGIPVRYIGIGERAEDLRPFDPESFVDAIFNAESAQEEPQDV